MESKSGQKQLKWFGLLLWCGLLVVVAYGDSLSLPFFFDDLVQVPHASEHDLVEAWLRDGGSRYYRPLGATIWYLSFQLLGKNSASFHHALNLFLHLLNGMLVALLVEKTGSNSRWPALTLRGFFSASLFLLFPFSYQTVPWIGAIFHILMTTLILGSIICYLNFEKSNRLIWALFSFLFALLAPFAHEIGILAGPILLLFIILGDAKVNWRAVGRGLLWFIPVFVWFVARSYAEGVGGGINWANLESVFQNSAYFLQSVAYPLTGMGGWLMRRFGWNDMVTAVSLSLIALIPVILLQLSQNRKRQTLIPWLFTIGALVPSIIFLEFAYVISSPRLLMLASVGIAWLWADVLSLLIEWIRSHTQNRILPLIPVGMLLLLLTTNYLFIRQRMHLHDLLSSVVNQAADLVQQSDEALVFVNIPTWMSYQDVTYALGHEGVVYMPGYIHKKKLISAQLEQEYDFMLLRYSDLQPQIPYYFDILGEGTDWPALKASGASVYLTEYAEDRFSLNLIGDFHAESASDTFSTFSTASNNSSILLRSSQITNTPEGISVKLVWQTPAPIDEDVTAFVHVVDSAGNLVAQADGYPLAGMYPMNIWPANSSIQDVRTIEGVTAENYQIYVGLYNRLTGERLQAANHLGDLWPNNAVQLNPAGD